MAQLKAKTPQRKKKKKQQQTIKKPIHRDRPSGIKYDVVSSFGAIVCSTRKQDLTTNQTTAFRKRITVKEMRRKFLSRAKPYLTMTKKPSEVRMGKGHGVKINRIINPLIKGSIICEIPVHIRFRRPEENGLSVYYTFVNAMKKLPPSYKVHRCDL